MILISSCFSVSQSPARSEECQRSSGCHSNGLVQESPQPVPPSVTRFSCLRQNPGAPPTNTGMYM